MTDISNQIKSPGLAFAQFKSFQDLSHNDIAAIFKCSRDDSVQWSKGNVPDEITKIAVIANNVAERARLRGMSDTDIQYFEKQKSELEEEIKNLTDDLWSAAINLKRIRLNANKLFVGKFKRMCMWAARANKDELT
jgi:hypothetical protein